MILPQQDPQRDPPERDLVDALVQSAFTVMAALNKAGARHDLSLTQLRVLAILRDRRLPMTALADYLGLEKSTMSGLVDRAERRGLVGRAPNATDRRSVEVFLTSDGVELTQRVYLEVEASLTDLTRTIPAAGRRRLAALLHQAGSSTGRQGAP